MIYDSFFSDGFDFLADGLQLCVYRQHAIIGLSKTSAKEVIGRGIRVNTVAP